LQELTTGDHLQIEKRNAYLEIINGAGVSVGRLSRAAEGAWAAKLATIKEIRVLAMVRRYKQDVTDKVFRERCYGESWETPVIELTYWP